MYCTGGRVVVTHTCRLPAAPCSPGIPHSLAPCRRRLGRLNVVGAAQRGTAQHSGRRHTTAQTGACTELPAHYTSGCRHQSSAPLKQKETTAVSSAADCCSSKYDKKLTTGIAGDAARVFGCLGPGALLTLLVTLMWLEGTLLTPAADAFRVARRLITSPAHCESPSTGQADA